MLQVIFAFTQNSNPRKPCLSSFEREKLKKLRIIMHRNSPFAIVISDIEWISSAPRTTSDIHIYIFFIKKFIIFPNEKYTKIKASKKAQKNIKSPLISNIFARVAHTTHKKYPQTRVNIK